MGITGTKVAQSAADIVILDDKFSSIVKAISWGRSVYDNIRKFLQFQLTVNLVALWLVFIAATAGFVVPLNAVQLLWVNLVMDTMGALALGTEMPTPALLKRKPYKRSATLISRPMMRNICCQSTFQLILLFVLLFAGADLFGVPPSDQCDVYKVGNGAKAWNLNTNKRDDAGQFTCSDFNTYCNGKGDECMDMKYTFSYITPVNGSTTYPGATPTLYDVEMNHLKDFKETCLTCTKENHLLVSIIFNAFIFCQLFNEYNARFILDEKNPFQDVAKNHIFLFVTLFTAGCQIFLIQVGGEFVKTTPLTPAQWLITIALGAISLPIGFLMRFIPVKEDPDSFFDNSADTTTYGMINQIGQDENV
jgi:magnesium-transporting ATPase (P-type)